MAYNAEVKNVLNQLGNYSCTFVLTDDEGVMPEVVLEKNFVDGPNLNQMISNSKIIDCLIYENQYLMGL